MRNLKRFLAMALTVLMVVGSFSAMSVSAFDDVDEYQEAIDVMAALGIVCGEDETTFNPDESVLRWHMALWITKMMTGKVDTAYVEANFNTALNSTVYTDLNEGQYMGATAYAANNGIVVGTSATTYEPEAEIMIQDVFTMVVRMLGYGSTAMNANYPWSFIDKAISLDLDAGLPADYANEKAATRGETAQILYNALTAVKADGSTLGYDFFGLEKATVIITGTKDGNMFNADAKVVTKKADGVDQVAFNVLNADGTIGAATYYAPKTAFGIDEEANANAYVGYPFVVRTVDAFETFMTCDAIAPVALTQDEVVGSSSSSSGTKTVTIEGDAYTLVKTYSDFSVDGADEIILNMEGTLANVVDYGSYVMDENLNIMGKDGNVLLKWVQIGNPGGNSFQNGTYLFEVADGKYIVPNDAIWAQAATYTTETSAKGYKVIENSYTDIYANGAYSDTVVFDLDGDGKYDRGIYTQYAFAKMTVNSSGYLLANGARVDSADVKATAMTYVNTDGETVDVTNKYVLYAYNDLYKTVIVKAEYEVSTGLVTSVNIPAAKITFNQYGLDFINGSAAIAGETYDIGKARLAGVVSAASEGYFTAAIGKNMNYVVDEDGDILAVADYANGPYYMVVATEQVVNYTTMGYQTILAYFNTATNKAAATQGLVTVNALNNYWYGGMINNAIAGAQPNFVRGDLLKATKDAMGNYDVVELDMTKTDAANKIYVDTDAAADITVNNGIVVFDVAGQTIAPFKAAADTVWLVKKTDNSIETYVGIPANGTTFNATALFINGDDFIYVIGTVSKGAFANTNDGWNAQSTIVYVDDTCANAWLGTNVFGNQLFYTDTYSYNNAIDIYTGAYVNNLYTANGMARLQKGHFYKVEAGYVVAEVKAADYVDAGILVSADKQGKLTADADKYNFKLYADIDPADITAANEYQLTAADTLVSKTALATLYGMKNTTDVINVDALIATNRDAGSGDELILANIYAAVNDADNKTGVLVWYAKGAAESNAPVFFAKNATAITVKAIPTTDDTTYAVVYRNNEQAITLTDGAATFKFEYAPTENVTKWALVDKNGEYVEYTEIGLNKYAVAVTKDMFEDDTANVYTADKVLILNIGALGKPVTWVNFETAEEYADVFAVTQNGKYFDAVDNTARIPLAKSINVEAGDEYTVSEIAFKYHNAINCSDEECDHENHWIDLPNNKKGSWTVVDEGRCWNLTLTDDLACNDGQIRIKIDAQVLVDFAVTIIDETEQSGGTYAIAGRGNWTGITEEETVVESKMDLVEGAAVKISVPEEYYVEGAEQDENDHWIVEVSYENPTAEVEIKEYAPVMIGVDGIAAADVDIAVFVGNTPERVAAATAVDYEAEYILDYVTEEELAEFSGTYTLKVYFGNNDAPTVELNGEEIEGEFDADGYCLYIIDEFVDGVAEVEITPAN